MWADVPLIDPVITASPFTLYIWYAFNGRADSTQSVRPCQLTVVSEVGVTGSLAVALERMFTG